MNVHNRSSAQLALLQILFFTSGLFAENVQVQRDQNMDFSKI
jgi:hypothetical protein